MDSGLGPLGSPATGPFWWFLLVFERLRAIAGFKDPVKEAGARNRCGCCFIAPTGRAKRPSQARSHLTWRSSVTLQYYATISETHSVVLESSPITTLSRRGPFAGTCTHARMHSADNPASINAPYYIGHIKSAYPYCRSIITTIAPPFLCRPGVNVSPLVSRPSALHQPGGPCVGSCRGNAGDRRHDL